MSVLNYNEIKERKYVILDGDPYEVLDSHVFRKQQRKPVNQAKLRNLINGSVRNETFHVADTVQEADIGKKKVKFIFQKENRQAGMTEFWFSNINNPSDRFMISESVIGDQIKFMKPNSEVDAMTFDDLVIGIKVPIKVTLLVKEAAPAVKGNTATGASKIVVLETGATLNTPLFVNEGDSVVVNTETGEYVERTKA